MAVVTDDTDAQASQGALRLGPEQIPETGRPHRAGAQGAQRSVESRSRSEPTESSEPALGREPKFANEPPGQREPKARSTKRRPISIPHDPTESQLHQSIAQLLDWILVEPAFYTTFPAGWGRLSKGTAGRLFASGLKKGMPDILVFAPSRIIGIELKAGHNSVTAAQRDMFARLQGVGVTVYVCRDQHGVVLALRDADIPHRKHSIQEST